MKNIIVGGNKNTLLKIDFISFFPFPQVIINIPTETNNKKNQINHILIRKQYNLVRKMHQYKKNQ